MRNTLKQAIVLWGMVLLLVLWSVFISPSGVLRWAGAAAIVLAVAALLIYRRRQAWTEMTGDAGLSSLPPETYRQPVVLVCGGLSAHLFTDSPVRQVSEGLYLHVPDEEQLVRALSGGIYQVLQDNGRRLFDIVPVDEPAKEETIGGGNHDS